MQMRMMHRVCPYVYSTAKNPIAAPRCLGSAALVRNVSATARKRIPDDRFILQGDDGDRVRNREDDVEVLRLQDLGLPVGDPCGACQGLTLGTMGTRQELYQTRVWPHWSHCSTWPPSAAARHRSIASSRVAGRARASRPRRPDRSRRSGGTRPPRSAWSDRWRTLRPWWRWQM
jgi:hypothetical protein